jgi:hypothetical protein
MQEQINNFLDIIPTVLSIILVSEPLSKYLVPTKNKYVNKKNSNTIEILIAFLCFWLLHYGYFIIINIIFQQINWEETEIQKPEFIMIKSAIIILITNFNKYRNKNRPLIFTLFVFGWSIFTLIFAYLYIIEGFFVFQIAFVIMLLIFITYDIIYKKT